MHDKHFLFESLFIRLCVCVCVKLWLTTKNAFCSHNWRTKGRFFLRQGCLDSRTRQSLAVSSGQSNKFLLSSKHPDHWPFFSLATFTEHLNVFQTVHYQHSRVPNKVGLDWTILWECDTRLFFFVAPWTLSSVVFVAVSGGSSSHFSIQIAHKLFNSHSVANKIGHSLLAPHPAGTDTDHRPNLTTVLENHNKPRQHNFARVNGVCKI